jgi:hypothetical protein
MVEEHKDIKTIETVVKSETKPMEVIESEDKKTPVMETEKPVVETMIPKTMVPMVEKEEQ